MTLADIVVGHKSRPYKVKDSVVESLTVTVVKAKEPKKGQDGDRVWFSTMLVVSDGSGQDSVVFVNGNHTPAIGSQVTLEGVKFYSYEEKARDKGGTFKNLGLTATGLTGQSATPPAPGPAGHSSPAPAGNGNRQGYGYDDPPEKRVSIEAQATMHAAADMVAAAYSGVIQKGIVAGPEMLKAFDNFYDHLWAKLQVAKSAALPAKSAADVGGQPGKAAGQAEQPGIFTDALAARSILLRICENDTARAKAAFFNLTGFQLIADCKDAAMAQGWLTACQNIDAMYQKCAAVNRPAFVKKLAEPGLAPEIRDSELQRLAGEPDPEAIF